MARRRIPRAPILRRLGRAEDGSFLVEALVSALIIVIVGVGVLEGIDRSARLGGQQKAQAVAGNIAHAEQEQVRALPLAEQSNLRRTTSKTVEGVTYTVATRADWINDSSGDADCTTAGASADYMKLSTVVTWPQISTRKPVSLVSLITPGVRSVTAAQGALAVQVTDRNGAGLAGLQLNLAGPATLTDTTSESGCVMWGYLPAASGYTLSFARPPDYVTPDGSTTVSKPVAVVGEHTSNVSLRYDRGGHLQTSFVTKNTRLGPNIPTNPQFAHVTNSGGGGVSVSYPVSATTATSGLLFPFLSPYTVQADTCAASDVPPTPAPPVPATPAAPAATTGVVSPGITTTTTTMRIPSPNIRVVSGGTPIVGATVKVTTGCGTVYRRTTVTDGVLADPGFPYGSLLQVCASDGSRKVETTAPNTNFNQSVNFNVDLGAQTGTGGCG